MAPDDHPCDVSPFCGPIPEQLRSLGVPTDLPVRWCHLGPIRTDAARVVQHWTCSYSRSRVLAATGGLGRFGGYHLDVLGMSSPPPGVAANYHQLLQVWYVYAVAWRDPDGPRVEWCAEPCGPGELTIRQRGPLAQPDAEAVAGRCKDLLQGRLTPRGRPPKTDDEVLVGAELGVRAEAIKARCPRKTWRVIARQVGVDERTLRRVRADAKRLGLISADGAAGTRRLA